MWKEQSEFCPRAGLAFELDAPAMTFDDVFDDAQPNPCALRFAAKFRTEAIKAFEDPGVFGPRNSRAGVGNR